MASDLRRRPRLGYEVAIVLLAVLAVLPWVAFAAGSLLFGPLDGETRWALLAACVVLTGAALALLRSRLAYPLRTLANVIASMREEDYSFRARGARRDDALGEVMTEINELAAALRGQRIGAREATALARTVIHELDAAIFAFDGDFRLQLVNPAGAELLAQPASQLTGRTAEELGLADLLRIEDRCTIDSTFRGRSGRWSVRLSAFRELGRVHQLLVITDLSRALREEERQAWQRLLRVIGHELNNSLAPIQSIASSLETIAVRETLSPEFRDDLRRGLQIIGSRATALSRFMEAYSRLARLPPPRLAAVDVQTVLRRAVDLANDPRVRIVPGKDATIHADPDQIEQALINVVRNALDASSETGGGVTVTWDAQPRTIAIRVVDEGRGITGRTNLFVPFFTTKPGGTGIGLVLSRQIAEAHRGSLVLENRTDGCGCEARLTLPVAPIGSIEEAGDP